MRGRSQDNQYSRNFKGRSFSRNRRDGSSSHRNRNSGISSSRNGRKDERYRHKNEIRGSRNKYNERRTQVE